MIKILLQHIYAYTQRIFHGIKYCHASFFKRLLSICSLLYFIQLGSLHLQAQRIIYVNDDAAGLNDGSSWANAFLDLQAGLAVAQTGDEIWVAKGIYKPTNGIDRSFSFQLKNGVAIYGGFEGIETDLTQRDLAKIDALQNFIKTIDENSLNKQALVNNFSATILSGDIGAQDNREDNSYHVLFGNNIDNTTTLDALAIVEGHASGANFPNNSGGGMYNENSSPILTHCSFLLNTSLNFHGGAISNKQSAPNLEECYFVANQSLTFHAGGIFNDQSSPSLTKCFFLNNKGVDGGGMYNFNGSNPSIDSCIFDSNFASEAGGAISNSNSSPSLESCNFVSNIAGLSGGGISNQPECFPTLTNCRFKKNTAGINGGGMFTGFDSAPVLENCQFDSCTAQFGGAMNNFRSSPKMVRCDFSFNTASVSGGAIYSRIFGEPRFEFCTIKSNEARDAGGGIYNESCSPILLNCLFESNKSSRNGGGINNENSSPTIENCEFSNNDAGWSGGGISNEPESSPSIINCQFEANNAGIYGGGVFNGITSNPIVDSCHFEQNFATIGGGLMNFSGSSPQVKNCIFDSNRSTRNGGGMTNENSSPTIEGCEFNNNDARWSGGGISNEPASSPTIKNCQFASNTAGIYGGGLFNGFESSPMVDSCNFEFNQAQNGGGMSGFRSSPTLMNCLFEFNKAENTGGAILVAEGKTSIENSLISSSTAIQGGGVFIDRGEFEARNSTISGNSALVAGGGIFSKQTANIISTTIYQNTTDGLGASFYLGADASLNIRQSIVANELTSPDFYLESTQSIISEGNNLIGKGDGVDSWQDNDIVGNISDPVDPLLASLADNGGLTKTHAIKKNSPAIDAGGLLELTFDQRGYPRINSPQDSISDIGAYERHATQISSEDIFSCEGVDVETIALKNITLSDFAGGAFGIGDSLTLIFELTNGFKFNPGIGNLAFVGEGIQGVGDPIKVTPDSIIITYSRAFTTEISEIIISDLQITGGNTQEIEGALLRTGGTARQVDNMPEDATSIVRFLRLPLLSGEAFFQDFNNSDGNWFPTGQDNLWEWKVPEGSIISSNNPDAISWNTTLPNNGKYGPNNISVLLSSCFDLNSLENPFVSLDIWSDALDNFDGSVLQYTFIGEENWQTVGSDSTGIGWYDDIRILSSPGSTTPNADEFVYGWTGRDTSWIAAKHLLLLPDTVDKKVRFRMVFASGASVHPNQTNNGFAFDNFFIGDQEIRLLLEQFTNLEKAKSTNDLLAASPEAIVPIRYFVDQRESFYDKNVIGPRTRSLYYGISESGISVIGGIEYAGPTTGIKQDILARSILRGSIFDIKIDSTNQETPVQITSSGEFVDEEVIVYLALIENNVLDKGESYDHVFRKFLPNPAGQSFWNWERDMTKSIAITWPENQPPISAFIDSDNPDNLSLIVFVQNQETKEVYQVTKTQVWPALFDVLKKREGNSIEESVNLSLYPNPASDHVSLQLGKIAEENFKVSCYSPQGAKVKEFELKEGDSLYRLSTKDLAAGWYYVRVGTQTETWHQDRVVVIR